MNLVIDDACYAYENIFSQFGNICALPGREINSNSIKNADILIVRSRTRVDQALLENSKVKFIGSTVAGIDYIDTNYLKNNNIKFLSAQGCNAMAVAEYVIHAIVNLADYYKFEYQTKTLAIIGVGNVGARLANKANLMGIKTILNDPPRQEIENLPYFVDLNTALSADIVSVHTPLTFDGKYPSFSLLNEKNFNYINDKTILINTARGGVIKEKIWEKTKTMANVIDCWENEPDINKKLQNNAYLATPHIAGHSIDAKFMGSFMVYKALCKFLNHTPDKTITNLASSNTSIINQTSLKDTLNNIYDFKNDAVAIKNTKNFEHYRRHYPKRYEWNHYQSILALPIIT